MGCDTVASSGTIELRGSWGAVGIERASFPSVAGRLWGSWRGGAGRPSARSGEFDASFRCGSGVVGGDVSDAVFRFHDQALPRADRGPGDGGRPDVPAVLQLGEERVATAGADDQGASAGRASSQARAASAAGHDAVSGWFETRLAGPGT